MMTMTMMVYVFKLCHIFVSVGFELSAPERQGLSGSDISCSVCQISRTKHQQK